MDSLTYLSLDREVRQIRQSDVDAFAAQISGGVLSSADDAYDEARVVWNATVDRRPALIARCLTDSDVQAADMRTVRKTFNFSYHSAAHWVPIFRDFYGPTHKAFVVLDPAAQNALEKDITALLKRCNIAGPASLVVPGEYLEVVIAKHGG